MHAHAHLKVLDQHGRDELEPGAAPQCATGVNQRVNEAVVEHSLLHLRLLAQKACHNRLVRPAQLRVCHVRNLQAQSALGSHGLHSLPLQRRMQQHALPCGAAGTPGKQRADFSHTHRVPKKPLRSPLAT